jgi:hypothetical protein
MTNARARVTTTDAEIDAAIERAKEYEGKYPRVTRAEYQAGVDLVALYLASGMVVAIPRELMQGLQNATLEHLRNIEILGPGTGLDWPDLDVQHSVEGLINGVFGARRWMAEIGRAGGSVKSERKTEAARKNGSKGGRPQSKNASPALAKS